MIKLMDEAQEAETRQVFKQLENVKGRLIELGEITDRLRERLTPVLRSSITSEPEEKTTKEPERLVPLANDIKIIADKVNVVVIDIANMLKVLEL